METLGVITRVHEPTEWVNSMVTVLKKNGQLRICIDPRDLNNAIRREHYPMKTIEEIIARMPNARYFSVLDASSGYWQVLLDQESSKLCTFNTPFGRYRFLRPPLYQGQPVFFQCSNQWSPATITNVLQSPRSYIITTAEGQQYRRNRKHLRPRHNDQVTSHSEDDDGDFEEEDDNQHENQVEDNDTQGQGSQTGTHNHPSQNTTNSTQPTVTLRRSQRKTTRPLTYADPYSLRF